jgi:hypothetical protein
MQVFHPRKIRRSGSYLLDNGTYSFITDVTGEPPSQDIPIVYWSAGATNNPGP